ncbi:beta-ketoacyl synthase [Calothrix sp. NIES-4071]|nr:beta-ketoacyl synthase [Calothrix sp. NIES-4071]BAZ54958.1 beta-ketoacyl synthase [Calothrix sp. NIES-4105]
MESIAIIGMGVRFPGAKNLESFWHLLREGVDAITEIPTERWNIDEFYDPKPATPGKMITRRGGFLEQVDHFDASFFGISPREAECIDPQQRLVLEVTWEALENAGIAPDKLAGSQTGVFIGIGNYDYGRLQSKSFSRLNTYDGPGTTLGIAANRLSYTLDLRGPSLVVETSCSSSLVAVHLACQSLHTRESNLCLVSGVSLILSPESNIIFSHAQMMAPDDRCKTFDASANGYVRGEGCGVIVLKRLTEALRDGDNIAAIIKGSAVNQDGLSNGLTAPNGPSQQAVIRKALENAGVAPANISYVEAHGTGTSLGDPIEIKSLKTVLMKGRHPTQTCYIGSVKTNIGHLEPAAGIAGLIKVALSLQNKQIPPHLHFKKLNSYIKIENTPFAIPTKLQKWTVEQGARLAGISAFGFGGTNAHVILEEAPAPLTVATNERSKHLLTLSAKSEKALQQLAQSYEAYLKSHLEVSLEDVCFTANTGRAHFKHRLAIVADSTMQLREQLSVVATRKDTNGLVSGIVTSKRRPQIAFLFTGQGSQYIGMGQQLYQTQPVFRQALEECDKFLRNYLEQPLLDILYHQDASVSSSCLLDQTSYTQPALFAIEYALGRLWQSWGIQPDVVIGHSVGEYVAACIAGVFSLEDGLKLVAHRGRLMQALPCNGKMVSVLANEATVTQAIKSKQAQVEIAAKNGSESLVISGQQDQVDIVKAVLESQGIKTKELNVSHAFHSDLMQPMLLEFETIAKLVTYHSPQIPLISNVTGQKADKSITTPQYWVRHVVQPVRFAQGMETLHKLGNSVFLEIGSKPILLGMGRQCLPADVGVWLPSLRPGVEDWQQMLDSLAQLYVQGVQIDWSGFEVNYVHRKVVLPTYPFQRQRYWIKTEDHTYKKQLSKSETLHPLLGQKLNLELHLAGLEKQHCFEAQISASDPAYLNDHQVFNRALFPATAYLEIALAAGFNVFKSHNFVVEDVVLQQGLILPQEEITTVQTIISNSNGAYKFQIFTQQKDKHSELSWILHAQGKIRTLETEVIPPAVNLEKHLTECEQFINVTDYYQKCLTQGINYGVSFQGIQQLWKGSKQAVGKINLSTEVVEQAEDYCLHPALLDAALQVMGAAVESANNDQTYLPVRIEQLRVYRRSDTQVWAISSISQLQDTSADLSAKVTLLNDDGETIAIVEGLQVKRATVQTLLGDFVQPIKENLYEVQWRQKARFSQLFPPDYLLKPQEVEQKLSPSISQLVALHDLHDYGETLTHLEKLSVEYIVRAFKEMGWAYQPGENFTLEAAAQRLGVVPSHRRLFNRLLQILAELGILNYSEPQWQVRKPLLQSKLEEKIKQTYSQYSQIPAEITLLHRCASRLSEVLRGAIDAVELVFPQGDLTTVTQLYQESPSAKVMNTLLQQAVTTALEKLPSVLGVRLLEIGAGTGGSTSFILPHLNPYQSEYVFTDIGAFFNSKAKEKFKDYPFVRYQILDIEVDPTTQGFQPHQYDIIIAANVLHATTSISQTLSHVRQLLAPGGILVLLESTTRQRWLDLIFGLLDGWWKFNDSDLRPDYALLSTYSWQKLLKEKGFAQVSTLPNTEGVPEALSQQALIIAQTESTKQSLTVKEPKGWLILSDQQGVGRQLASQLRSIGEVCTLVNAGEKYKQVTSQEFTINPYQQEDFHRLVAYMATQSPQLYGVVQCWSLEAGLNQNLSAQELESLSQLGCGATLFLVQSLVKAELPQQARLWLVTTGAQPVPANSPIIPGVAQSSLWGMGKVIALEHPELECVRIDLDPNQTTKQQGKALWSEICDSDQEDQIALRDYNRYVARLVHSSHAQKLKQQLKVPSSPWRLTTLAGGTLENLTLEPTTRHSPAPDEVEIRVLATGLNFLDVVAALGLLPLQVDGISQKHLLSINGLGGECAGEIVAIGERVKGFKIGEPVIALAPGSFSQYVTVSATSVIPKPKQLSFEEAASIPVNFLTAYYALHHVAKIRKGERVLIHAAAGGTGMAAVQIAQQAGAEVFATASPAKWEILRAMGVKHIMNSRTVEFSQDVMEITQGQGVDIVLNSLTSGEFISKSLAVVSNKGRFVEIAKRFVWESTQVAAVRPDISYFVVDLVREQEQQPKLIQSMLQELAEKFNRGLLQPPPLKVFPSEEVVNAFRYMQQAKHIGKIVVSQTESRTDATTQIPLSLRRDSTYLITGGFGGLGLVVARWMVELGAKHVVLAGHNPPNDLQERQIKELEEAGATVIVKQVDVCEYESMAQVFTYIEQSLPPLAGVIHSVGVLEDGVLLSQNWCRFAKVMNPKVKGAWNLHQLTKNQPLDFFVLFSSVASLFGSPAQGNHSAANAFLDGLAHYRQAMGLPGLSVNLGPVSQVGEATERGADVKIQQKGIEAITPSQVLEALELLIKSSAVQVGVVPIEWSVWRQGSQWPFWEDWQELVHHDSASQPEFLQQLHSSMPSEQQEMLINYVRRQVAQILGLTDSQLISLDAGFFDLGMDSLTSIELRNCLQTSLKCSIPPTVAFDYPTVGELVNYLAQQVIQVEASDTSVTESRESQDVEKQLLVKTKELSEEQLEELINQKFNLLIHE